MTAPIWLPKLESALAADDARRSRRFPRPTCTATACCRRRSAVYEQVIGRALPPPPRRFGDFDDFSRYIVEHLWPALRELRGVRALIARRVRAPDRRRRGLRRDELRSAAAARRSGSRRHSSPPCSAKRWTASPTASPSRPRSASTAPCRPTRCCRWLRDWIDTGVYRSIDLYGDERLGDAARLRSALRTRRGARSEAQGARRRAVRRRRACAPRRGARPPRHAPRRARRRGSRHHGACSPSAAPCCTSARPATCALGICDVVRRPPGPRSSAAGVARHRQHRRLHASSAPASATRCSPWRAWASPPTRSPRIIERGLAEAAADP